MSNLNICYLTRHDSLKHAGIGRVYLNIKNGMVERGHTVKTVASNDNSPAQYLKYFMFDIIRKIPKGSDVYHAMTPIETIYAPKAKTIVSLHDLIPIRTPALSGSGLNNSIFSRIVGQASYQLAFATSAKCAVIVATCDNLKREIVDFLRIPDKKVRVVRLGINPDLDYMPGRVKNEVPVIGYIGQLDQRKRVRLLIQSFLQANIDAQLLIAGTGVDEPKLRALANNDSRIHFLGFVPDSMLCAFYNKLDCFVFPSCAEGYGLPLVEAMACKVPVITLSDAIIPAEVQSHTYICEPGELARTLKNIGHVKNWVNVDSAYQFAKLHDWNKTVDEYLKLYLEIAQM